MEDIGKRYIYIIVSASNYDGLNPNVWYATRNKEEAIRRFKWMYDVWIRADYTNDEGNIYAEHHCSVDISQTDPKCVSGYFYFYDDDGGCSYMLKSLKTDHFFGGFNGPNTRAEGEYKNYIARNH